jgi:RND family efflux transporter MFP subunit
MRILYILTILIFFQSCNSPTSEKGKVNIKVPNAVQINKPAVKTIIVAKGNFDLEVLSNGKAFANNNAEVKFPFAGKIKSINIQNGDQVTTGQVLAELDDYDLKRVLYRNKEALDRSVVELDDRLIDYGYRLKDSSTIPKDILKMAKMKSNYNSSKFEYNEALLSIKKTIVKSPLPGKIANLEASKFNNTDSYKLLCNIIDDKLMRIDFYVLESEFAFVSRGSSIDVIPYGTNIILPGRIKYVNPIIESNGMIKIAGEVRNLNSVLINGMSVKVVIKKSLANKIYIPKDAILQRQNKDVVFTYKDGHSVWNYVEIEYQNSKFAAIKTGLIPGEQVIIGNNLNLANNTEVTLERDTVLN